jgi:O-antigen/teichoic acid export membrane protein
VVYSLIILILVYILKKSLKIKLIHIKNIKVRPKEWLKISLPIMLVSSISVLFMSQIDLTMLEVMGKDENSVGYYAAGLKTAGIIILLTTTTSTVFTPIISQAIDKSKKHLKHIYRVQFYFSIVVCIIIIFVLFIFGCNFLTLFGNSYITAYSTMLILSIGYGAILISNGAYIILQYSNSAKFLLFSNLFGVTLNFILNWFLIPIYDIEGAAIATACSMSSIATLHIFHIWQKHKIT